MPAEHVNVSFEPRPLELLYYKYCNNKATTKTAAASSTTTPFPTTQPSRSSLKQQQQHNGNVAATGAGGKKVGHSVDLPPRAARRPRQELGDLRKLGRELTKMERVQMLLDMSRPAGCQKSSGHSGGGGQAHHKSRSQPTSAGLKDGDVKCWSTSCPRCSQEQRQEAGQMKLKDLKSKLKLVAARTLPSDLSSHSSHPLQSLQTSSTSPLARHSSQHVVPLPLLPGVSYKRHASSSEDFSALRDASKSLRHMFFPQPSISRRAAAIRNYRFTAGGNAPPPGHGILKDKEKKADSSDSSSQLMPSAVVPACSPVDDLYETKTVTTFDADRVDSEQFGYVFEHINGASSSGSWVSTSAISDTATYSARAQRPSTADSVPTPQSYVETRASMMPPISPASPRRTRGDGESWPPQYTVVPSWPAVDDPFRFQYFGCNVHRDMKRRLYKSRGRRRNGKHSDNSPPLPQPQPQKLKVVVPSYSACRTCSSLDCDQYAHIPKPAAPASRVPSYAASITAKSAKSRDSLNMSVCTVVSRQAQPAGSSSHVDAVPRLWDKGHPPAGKQAENVYGKPGTTSFSKSISSHVNSLD